MNQFTRNRLLTYTCLIIVAVSTRAWGQPPNGADPFPDATAAEAPSTPPLSRNAQLVLDSIRETDPQTPVAIISAVINLLNVGAEVEARSYFTQLLEQQRSAEELVQIYEALGVATVFRLAREPALAPEGVEFSREIVAAADAAARDPKRLLRYIESLTSESEDERLAAAHALAEGRELAAAALLQAIADPSQKADASQRHRAWRYFDGAALPPLIAALRCDNAALQYPALIALGQITDERAIPYLVGFAGTARDPLLRDTALNSLQRLSGIRGMPVDAAALLEDEVKRRLQGFTQPQFFPVDPAADQRLPVWHWDAASLQPQIARYGPRVTELMEANRLAHDLTRFTNEHGRLYRVSELALLKALYPNSDQALLDAASQRKAFQHDEALRQLSADLAWALEHRVDEAALAACALLPKPGTEELLHTEAAVRSPLATALRSPNREVRHAAAAAIMKIAPTNSFMGAADLMPIALGLATGSGAPQALIIHPLADEAGDLAGHLSAARWNAVAVQTGREAMRQLYASPDFGLILLSDAVWQPRFTEVLQQLRFDHRTAEIPMAVISRRGELSTVEALIAPLAARHPELPPIVVFPFPRQSDSMTVLLRRVVGPSGVRTDPRRVANRETALTWLAKVTEDLPKYAFLELAQSDEQIAEALFDPETASLAAQILGQLGTPTAQRALRNAIEGYPPGTEVGVAVRRAFAEAVRQRGVLVQRDR